MPEVRDTAIAGVLLALALLPKLIGLIGPFALLGPNASDMLWLPAALYLVAAGIRFAAAIDAPLSSSAGGNLRPALAAAAQRIAPVIGLLARLAFVVVVARSIADPTHSSLPQRALATAIAALPAMGQIVSTLVIAAALLISLPIVVSVLAIMVDSKPGENLGPSVAQKTTKWLRARTFRVAGYLLPVAARACLRLMAAGGYLLVAAVLWIAYGLRGFQLLTANRDAARVRPTFGGQLLAIAGLLRGTVVSGASLGGLFARQQPGVHRDVIRVRVQGNGTQRDDWRLPSNAPAALQELAEFANAVVVAYQTALSSGAGKSRQPGPQPDMDDPFDDELMAGRGRKPSSRYTEYQLTVSRAWSTANYHALVLRVSPAIAAEDAAKLTAARLIPLIDARSSWSAPDLADGLSLSDPRLRSDDHREGQTGLFITLARSAAEVEEAPPDESAGYRDEVIKAIHRGLVEKKLPANMFRLVGPPERTFDKLIYRFTTGNWTQTQAAGQIAARLELIETWKSLRDAIRVFGGHPDEEIHLGHDDRKREFVLVLDVDPPPFPGDKPGDDRVLLASFMRANGDAMRRTDPRRFCLGLDYEGDPVWASFAVTPHALVAGTTGAGKSVSGVLGPMLQLAYTNPASDFGMWIVDTKHEAHLFFGDLPHTRRIFTPEGIEDVLPFLQEFDAEAKRRRLAYAGQDWHPGVGDPFLVLVLEEWFQLIESAKSRDVGKTIEQVEATIKSINAIARSAGCHVVLATQDPRKETLPSSLADLLPLKLVTYGINEPMLRVIFGSQVDLALAQVPKGKRGRLAVDGAVDVDGVVQVQALWSHDNAHKPPADIKALIAEIVTRWGPREKPVKDEQPKPRPVFDPFVDRTVSDEMSEDDQEGEDLDTFERRVPSEASRDDRDDYDAALPAMPPASDFDADADPMTFARGVLRLAYRYNAGHDRWQPISQSRVDELIRDVPGRSSSVRIERIGQALRLLTDAGVLVPIATSLRGERQLHILDWREAEEQLAVANEEAA